jgi:hypothetical protein
MSTSDIEKSRGGGNEMNVEGEDDREGYKGSDVPHLVCCLL